MPNYQLGKIYMVYSIENPEDRYYGSTIQPLYKRFFTHKNKYAMIVRGTSKTSTTSAILFKKYGEEGLKIELVEKFPCNSKDELEAREGHYIRTNNCVNIRVNRLEGETYYNTHKEEVDKKRATYREEHRQEIRDKAKEYKQENREKYLADKKRHYENEPIIQCECGMEIKKHSLNRHLKRAIHLDKLNSKK